MFKLLLLRALNFHDEAMEISGYIWIIALQKKVFNSRGIKLFRFVFRRFVKEVQFRQK